VGFQSKLAPPTLSRDTDINNTPSDIWATRYDKTSTDQQSPRPDLGTNANEEATY